MSAFSITLKRPQFRLKTLFILVVFVSVPLAVWAHRERQYQLQLALVSILGGASAKGDADIGQGPLRNVGSKHVTADTLKRGEVLVGVSIKGPVRDEVVSAIQRVRSLTSFHFFHSEPSESQFAKMVDGHRVEFLRFQYCEIGDDVVRHLTGQNSMRQLTLDHTKISGASLSCLDSIPQLRVLNLTANKISDETLTHLSALSKLTSLNLDETPISDNGLTHLRALTSLNSLSLRHCAISDAGVADVAALGKLNYLDLSKTRISDRGLAPLKRLTALISLSLEDCAISESAVDDLADLLTTIKGLHNLNLTGTLMSGEAVARLETRVPGRDITWQEIPENIRKIKAQYGY